MVRAILDGRKTVTRRVIKLPPPPRACSFCGSSDFESVHHALTVCCGKCGEPHRYAAGAVSRVVKLPWRVGDRLWVREAFCRVPTRELLHGGALHGEAPAHKIDGSDPSVAFVYKCSCVGDRKLDWKPSIHMPRAASRITLEVVSVTAERLQDITEEDAIAEGVVPDGNHMDDFAKKSGCFVGAFSRLWDSLNAKRGFGWDANPWVWRVGFKVLDVRG